MNVTLSIDDQLVTRARKKAEALGLFSEDMQHTRDIDGLQIVNPFK
jgi:predicted nucleic acid-binding protein